MKNKQWQTNQILKTIITINKTILNQHITDKKHPKDHQIKKMHHKSLHHNQVIEGDNKNQMVSTVLPKEVYNNQLTHSQQTK